MYIMTVMALWRYRAIALLDTTHTLLGYHPWPPTPLVTWPTTPTSPEPSARLPSPAFRLVTAAQLKNTVENTDVAALTDLPALPTLATTVGANTLAPTPETSGDHNGCVPWSPWALQPTTILPTRLRLYHPQ